MKLVTLNGSRQFNGALNMLLAQAMFVISQQWQKKEHYQNRDWPRT